MTLRSPYVALVLLPLLLAVGCAKRPTMSQMAAPPPTGGPATASAAMAATPTGGAPAVMASPAPPRPAPEEYMSIPQLRDVYFDFDRYDIKPAASRILDANIDWLKTHASAQILIEGHCDERGTNAYNLALGERRAKATRDYLISRGVASDRIVTISYGEERPVCMALDESCWSRNRRAHFLAKQQ